MAATLAGRILAARETWCDLGEGLRVRVRRPAETSLGQAVRKLDAPTVLGMVTGWDGFSEATFFGAAVGSADPLPFDAEAWRAYAEDRADWVGLLSTHLVQQIELHMESTKERRGN